MNTGQYISAAGHLGLIAYALFGGLFLRPDAPEAVAVQEVALISESEYAALVERSTAPEDFEEAPVVTAPESELPPDVVPSEEASAPEPTPQPPAEPEPVVEPTPPVAPPEPEVSLEDPGANLPDAAEPTPRPVPRISDQVVTAPEPTPEIAEVPQEAISEEAETPEIVEEQTEEAAPQETTTEIVTEAEKPAGMTSSPRPKTRPSNLAQEAAQAREPVEQPEPPVTPVPDAADAVAEAAAAAAAALAAEATGAPAAPERPAGPPLTAGEREGMRVAVSQCWNVGSMSSEAMRTVIRVRMSMNEDGTPQIGTIELIDFEGGSQASADQAFAVARRAIIRCGQSGFPLPVDKYAHWRNIELRFDPEQMRYK
ncbi:energy transducer TonB [Celeribacter litoreus]|uniref:energy transducer TonB n=1 Tax=Celeribacter litoreus TaxID=2876714 RepID=UPI001CCD1094|nr:energy transducer TonB [Celeribacter litoreus]MCA0044029.1 energy transducer TonB [Celeribacter litoreus]